MLPESDVAASSPVHLEPRGEGDRPGLEKLVGDRAMMKHLGGPQGPGRVTERQGDRERSGCKQFKVVVHVTRGAIGWVGHWERGWRGAEICEIGWTILPAFQRCGFAPVATARAATLARLERKHRATRAFPPVDNDASNAVCRRAGFTQVEECELEDPRGRYMKSTDWRFDLVGGAPPASRSPAR
ncbi:MAG TPA: GNAT family N-acetyltransferase [Candidatus Dormibacteraeota bacterium]|nr:GNAT family N-acetyltransferase [Candidatus Dormibacteraeota bacterium]